MPACRVECNVVPCSLHKGSVGTKANTLYVGHMTIWCKSNAQPLLAQYCMNGMIFQPLEGEKRRICAWLAA
eukprot:359919-Chlamydomonas_euryale.AAC.5